MSDADAVIEAMAAAFYEARYGLPWSRLGPRAAGTAAEFCDHMRAALRAAEAMGWRLVPVEATEETEEAADEPFHQAFQESIARNKRLYPGKNPCAFASAEFSRTMWSAMLAAAPSLTGGDDA